MISWNLYNSLSTIPIINVLWPDQDLRIPAIVARAPPANMAGLNAKTRRQRPRPFYWNCGTTSSANSSIPFVSGKSTNQPMNFVMPASIRR